METISTIRNKKNITIEEMAEQMKISTTSYFYYETGKRKIPLDKAKEIAAILGVKLEDVFMPSTFSIR